MNLRSPTVALAAVAASLAACSPDFDPASRVEKLRLLAIRADPPEIEPASAAAAAPDRASLTALVLRADFAAHPGRVTTVLYAACLNPPGAPATSPCTDLATLRNPAAVAEAASRGACSPGSSDLLFLGAEACADGACGPARAAVAGTPVELPAPALVLPSGFGFGALPPGAPERVLGVNAQVLAFALDATPDELAAGAAGSCPAGEVGAALARLWSGREHVLATKSVRIRGPEAPDLPNQNPAVDGISADGQELASSGAPSALGAGIRLLRPVLPPDAQARHEIYGRLDAAGVLVSRGPEEWVASWFSTIGELKDLHSSETTPDEWKLRAGEAAAGRALVAAVVRDQRGGTAWAVREVQAP